jgi:hypothetical protein
MPRPPPEVPGSALARCGSGWLDVMRPDGFAAGSSRSTSLRDGPLEPQPSPKRPESLLQLAAPNPINETATKRGQMAHLRVRTSHSLARNKY